MLWIFVFSFFCQLSLAKEPENTLSALNDSSFFKSDLNFSKQESQNLLAQADTFDPFVDYGEFEDDVVEHASIDFFQNGRSLSVSFYGGYEPLAFNLRQLYGDAPFFGINVSFFVDLQMAFQLSGVFPTNHHSSLYNEGFPFSHFGLDLKYYWHRQYITQDKSFINPYIILGPFWMNIKPILPNALTNIPLSSGRNDGLSNEESAAVASFNSGGIKAGFGVEFNLLKQTFVGFEASYLYTVLYNENEDLSGLTLPNITPPQMNSSGFWFLDWIQGIIQEAIYPPRPIVKGYRFHGDIMNIGVFVGLNF